MFFGNPVPIVSVVILRRPKIPKSYQKFNLLDALICYFLFETKRNTKMVTLI